MSIFVVGDLHGDFVRLKYIEQFVKSEDTVIQVGDFGFYDTCLGEWDEIFPNGYPCRILAIDGNHEDFRILRNYSKDELTEVRKNLFYVPRGYVAEIEGKVFGFLGGGESVDKGFRRPEISWFADERIEHTDIDKLIDSLDGRQVDYFIAHVPPPFVINANFPPLNLSDWGLPIDWEDISSQRVEKARRLIQPKQMFCGHMHKSVRHDKICILDINEVVTL